MKINEKNIIVAIEAIRKNTAILKFKNFII